MEPFAKLFETEDYGQILVLLDSDDECKPVITVRFKPKGLGLCSLGLSGFSDTDEGWTRAEAVFRGFSEEEAKNAACTITQQLNTA